MFSACYARLIMHLSDNKPLLLITSQITEEDFKKWATALMNTDLTTTGQPSMSYGIIERTVHEPEFSATRFRVSVIKAAIVNCTSWLERYLKELVALCLLRSHSLLSKGFATQIESIDAKTILDYPDLDTLKLDLAENIANDRVKGKNWAEKSKRVMKFLDIMDGCGDLINMKGLNSLFGLRNSIAHGDNVLPNLFLNDCVFEINDRSVANEYFDIATSLLSYLDEAANMIKKLDSSALEKWPVTKENLIHR